MERYNKNLAIRKDNAKHYCELLESDKISFTKYRDDSSYFLFQIILDDSISRDNVITKLKNNDIGFSIHYATPVPLMSYYRNKYGYQAKDFPNALRDGNHSISLPVHAQISYNDIERISSLLLNI